MGPDMFIYPVLDRLMGLMGLMGLAGFDTNLYMLNSRLQSSLFRYTIAIPQDT